MTNTNKQDSSFAELGIAPNILAQLEKLNFTQPTPIQQQAIPVAITGQDLMGIAQTGTGKTIAFGIPMLQRLGNSNNTGLILLPTRELAVQVEQAIQTLGSGFGLKTVVLIGGVGSGPQIKALAKKPDIIIATPGRLIDLFDRKKVALDRVKMLVLDEADRMLDMGFEPQIRKILAAIPATQRQTMLFSATMPQAITKLANKYMRSPLRVEVAPAGTAAQNIEQEAFIVSRSQKADLLKNVLSKYHHQILIFSRTKHGAKKITSSIKAMGYTVAEIHSNKSLAQRAKALSSFKSGAVRILVATDIASRGIDVENIEVVINYDLPDNNEDYIHRIGRTARAGKAGRAISFVAPDQKGDLLAIERLVKNQLLVKSLFKGKERTVTTEELKSGSRSYKNKNRSPRRFEKKRRNRPSTFGRNRKSSGKFSNQRKGR